MGTVAANSFSGANGASWDTAYWETTTQNATTTPNLFSIDEGRGKVVMPAVAGKTNYFGARTKNSTGNGFKVDFLSTEFDTDSSFRISACGRGTYFPNYTGNPPNGYSVRIIPSTKSVALQKITAEVTSHLVTPTTYPFEANKFYTIDLRYGVGVFVWPSGTTKPRTPLLAWPAGETSYPTGWGQVGGRGGTNAVPRTLLYDNAVLYTDVPDDETGALYTQLARDKDSSGGTVTGASWPSPAPDGALLITTVGADKSAGTRLAVRTAGWTSFEPYLSASVSAAIGAKISEGTETGVSWGKESTTAMVVAVAQITGRTFDLSGARSFKSAVDDTDRISVKVTAGLAPSRGIAIAYSSSDSADSTTYGEPYPTFNNGYVRYTKYAPVDVDRVSTVIAMRSVATNDNMDVTITQGGADQVMAGVLFIPEGSSDPTATAPATPVLTGIVSTTGVTLGWTDTLGGRTGTTRYELRVNGVITNVGDARSFSLTGQPGDSFTVSVVAFHQEAIPQYSAWSPDQTFVVQNSGDIVGPAPVTDVTHLYNETDATLSLSWTNPADEDFLQVEIRRNGTTTAIVPRPDNTWVDGLGADESIPYSATYEAEYLPDENFVLVPGLTYTYAITPYDLNGNAGASVIRSVEIPLVGTPRFTQVVGQVVLPPGAVRASMYVRRVSTVNDSLFIDRALVSRGVANEWSRGGVSGQTLVSVERSTENGVWLPIRDGLNLPYDPGGQIVLADREVPPGKFVRYRVSSSIEIPVPLSSDPLVTPPILANQQTVWLKCPQDPSLDSRFYHGEKWLEIQHFRQIESKRLPYRRRPVIRRGVGEGLSFTAIFTVLSDEDRQRLFDLVDANLTLYLSTPREAWYVSASGSPEVEQDLFPQNGESEAYVIRVPFEEVERP